MNTEEEIYDLFAHGDMGRSEAIEELMALGHDLAEASRLVSEWTVDLEDNYDGPPDGEAWSGGFADNH